MRTLPVIYLQRDPRWAGQRLGTVDGSTIGQYGCYVSSLAMVAKYYGHDVTPASLDDLFTNGKFYNNGNLCSDDILQKVFADCKFVRAYNYPNTPADLNLLKTLISDLTISVILEVDFNYNPADGIQTHFVECVDCDGTKVTIADPWYGGIVDLSVHYGNNPAQTILKYVVYQGKPIAQTAQGGATNMFKLPSGAEVDTSNPASMQACAIVWDAVVNLHAYVEASKYNADMLGKDQTITNLNGTIATDSNQIKTQGQTINDMTLAATKLQATIDQLQPIADSVPELKIQTNQAIVDRNVAIDSLATANRAIAQLKATSYTTADVSVLFNELLARFSRWLTRQGVK